MKTKKLFLSLAALALLAGCTGTGISSTSETPDSSFNSAEVSTSAEDASSSIADSVYDSSILDDSSSVPDSTEDSSAEDSSTKAEAPAAQDVINSIGYTLTGQSGVATASGTGYYVAVNFGDLSSYGYTNLSFLKLFENSTSSMYIIPDGFVAEVLDQTSSFSDGTPVAYSDYVYNPDGTYVDTTLLELVTYQYVTYTAVTGLTTFVTGTTYYTTTDGTTYTAVDTTVTTSPVDGVIYYTSSTSYILQIWAEPVTLTE